MSQVKFDQREDIRVTTSTSNAGPRGGAPPMAPPHREGIAHEIGDALTKGAGPNGYLAVSTTHHDSRYGGDEETRR